VPRDDLLYGVSALDKQHVPGNGPLDDDTLQRESASYWMAQQIGLRGENRRYYVYFVNGVRHGGCDGVPGAAEFHYSMTPAGVILEYADRGQAFDPTKAPVPDVAAPIEHRPLGGLGIHLMRQIMRDIEYHRVDGWNRLRMRRPVLAEGK